MKHPMLILILALGLTSPALGSVDEARLHVKGLACPFCVFGIEKELEKVPGVVSLETTIRTGVVRIQIEPAASLNAGALNEAVKEAGFTPAKLEATVTGKLVTRDEKPALESSGSGQIFVLVEPGRPSGSISDESLVKLKRASEDGSRMLTISGHVHTHVDMPPALAVESFEVAR